MCEVKAKRYILTQRTKMYRLRLNKVAVYCIDVQTDSSIVVYIRPRVLVDCKYQYPNGEELFDLNLNKA